MRSHAKRCILAAVVGCLIVEGWSAHHVGAQQRTPLTMTRLYTGANGQTQAKSIEVSMLPSASLVGLDASEAVKVSDAQFVRWPPGYMRDWHPAERRQYVVALSGRGEVELAGGQKVPLSPGRILLVEDVTGKGHITRSTGSEELVLWLVPLAVQ